MNFKVKYDKGISQLDLTDITVTLRSGLAVTYACSESSVQEWYQNVSDGYTEETPLLERRELVFEVSPFEGDSRIVWVTVKEHGTDLTNRQAAVLLTHDY